MSALGKAIVKGYKATHDGVIRLYRKTQLEFIAYKSICLSLWFWFFICVRLNFRNTF